MPLEIGVLNCQTGSKGTGIAGCLAMLNNVQNFILVRKGWKANATTDTFDQETIDEYVQTGQWIVLPNHQSLESASEETVYETTDSGYMIYVRDGLAQFLAQYAKGVCFHKAMHSISLGSYDLLLVDFDNDGNGRLWGEETTDGGFKGFDLNLANAENLTFPTGTTSAKTPFRVQLSSKGTAALNKIINFVVSDEVDFASLNGVVDVSLVPVSATGGDFTFKVVSACDRSTSILGLDEVAFWQILDPSGNVENGWTISYTAGNYVVDGLDPGVEYTVKLHDTVLNSGIVAVDGQYYSSDSLSQNLTS